MITKRILLVTTFVAAIGLSQLSTAATPVCLNSENACAVLRTDDCQKAVRFYERLLESWCQTFYNSCFNLTYKKNSLAMVQITNKNDDETVVQIKGKHSYSGWATHNDVPFKAVIYYKGRNTYEIWFEKEVEHIIRDNTYESATRTITFSD